MNTHFAEHALQLAAHGYPVFPLQPRSKEPFPGTRGFMDATTDEAIVRRFWELAPASNIGLRPPPGVLVVDIDPRNQGHETLQALETQHGPLPPTLTAVTGGGGLHAYFRVPTELAWPKELGEGIDLKGHRSYVLAPPSIHDLTGRAYTWSSLAPMAEAPAWLVAHGYRPEERERVVIDEDEGALLPAGDVERLAAELGAFFEAGKKHQLAFALGGWLRQRGWNSADVVKLVRLLPSKNPAARAKDALDGFRARNDHGWHVIKQLCGEAPAAALDVAAPNPRRTRELAERAAAAALLPALGANAIAVPALPPQPMTPPPLAPGLSLPVIVGDARGSSFWVLRGTDYFSPVAKGMLPARYRETTGGQGEKQKADDLAAAAVIAEKVVRDFAVTGISWRAAERAIVHGYEPPKIAPVYDAQADAWLRALAGDRYGYLAQWFATCAQARIEALAACLVLVGGTGIGKTLIALLAARMWGASSPVPLAHAIDRFNSTITKCPIVLDDEAARMKQGDVATNDFREMLSARARTFEPKGVDRRELRGCQRFVITCNAFSDLRFSDVGALEVVEALADRLLVIQCGPPDAVREALGALRLAGSDDVDLTRLDGHVAWLVANTTVVTARFLASPGRNDPAARAAVLDGLVQRYPDLFDRVRDTIERGEHNAPVDPSAMFVHGGALWVRGEHAGGQLDARDVYRALAPWEVAPRRDTVKLGGSVVRARAYDLRRLSSELVPEAVTAVTQVTANPHSAQI